MAGAGPAGAGMGGVAAFAAAGGVSGLGVGTAASVDTFDMRIRLSHKVRAVGKRRSESFFG